MEETKAQITVKQVAITYGLYAGFVLIIFSLLVQMTGQVANRPLGMVSYIILIGAIVMAQKYYKQEGDGYLEYRTGLGLGTLLTLVAGALNTFVMYLYVRFIDDSMMQLLMDKQLEEMEKRGMSDEEIDMAMGWTETFMQPEILFPIGLVSFVFIGFVISLVVTAFTKKPKAAPQQF